uniref:Uncharacterized protein n=1 Tax=Meloidogyne enterolobii TaxID=390850 RepID=A0A6V7XZZ6_MELEN|nr:unnamed protein product [Meloidogyne enterolobii]
MERQQDKEVSGLALGNLANAYFCLSEYNKSIDCNEKLEIARDLDDKLAIGRTLINLAKAYNKLGNHELAERNLLYVFLNKNKKYIKILKCRPKNFKRT